MNSDSKLDTMAADIESRVKDMMSQVTGMRRTIDRLIDTESPALTDGNGNPVPNQTPAIECVVMFTSGQAIRGALSRTPEGTLRMMSAASENNKPVLVEQFFDYSAVGAISLVREVKAAPARRGSIIV